jgi:dolichyl-phosphate-mannose--protein O-mannosyl transferase
VIFVGFLGLYGALAPPGSPGPMAASSRAMSLFTLRSFGVFYLALALGVMPLLWERNLNTFLHHGLASYGLVIIITAAALAYLRLFDFASRPGGLAYFGAYLGVGIPLFFIFRKLGTGLRTRSFITRSHFSYLHRAALITVH